MKRFFFVLALLLAFPLDAAIMVRAHPVSTTTAGTSVTSSAIDTSYAGAYGALQCYWSSITGSVDGTVKLQVSLDNSNWTDKSSATFTMSGASGTNEISLNGTMTEHFYRAVYTHNSISGGNLDCYFEGR